MYTADDELDSSSAKAGMELIFTRTWRLMLVLGVVQHVLPGRGRATLRLVVGIMKENPKLFRGSEQNSNATQNKTAVEQELSLLLDRGRAVVAVVIILILLGCSVGGAFSLSVVAVMGL